MVGSRSPIEWLGRSRRTEALELCKEHIEEIFKTTKKMRKVFGLLKEGADKEEVEKAIKEVRENERKADEIKSKILDDLSEKDIHPIDREEIIRLAMTSDDIGDNANAGSSKVIFTNFGRIDDELIDDLYKLVEKDVEIVQTLKEAYTTLLKDPSEAINKTQEVERLEEEIDHFRAYSLLPKLIKWGNETTAIGDFSVIREVEGNLENLADETENVADVIRSIAVSLQ